MWLGEQDRLDPGLTMAFKLIQMARDRWRRLNGSHLLPLVRAGVQVTDGEQVEREDTDDRRTVIGEMADTVGGASRR